MRIVFSGGGTGGHIFPAVAVAQEVQRRHPDAEILFVGAKGKMEMQKVPKAGFDIEGLWISGFQRQLTTRNLLFPVKLVHSLWSAHGILRRFKPDAVAGFGGYASGAALYAASQKGIPTLIQEQNSYAGVTNKLLANRVDRVCVAYEEAKRFFPAEKTTLTGNPIRQDLTTIRDKAAAMAHFGLDPQKKTVLIAGGSLGARTLNQAMRDNLDKIKAHPNTQYIWQCGALYIDSYQSCDTAQLDHVHIMAFIDDMGAAYAAADIVLCRAGALTVSEICVQEKVSILVPSPNVAEDHQTKNAMALVRQDAALMVKDKDAQSSMIDELERVLAEESLQLRLKENIAKLAKPKAHMDITDQLLLLIR